MAVTPEMVKDITGLTLDDAVIQPFIDAADAIMVNIELCIASLTDAQKDQAGAFLSAHLITSTPVGGGGRLKSKESLDGQYSREYITSSFSSGGVRSTSYGQAANAITKGCLAETDKSPVGIYSIGCA